MIISISERGESMDDNKIGMNIKKYRKERFTQQELADKIGKTESSIRKYEKGLVTIPLDVLNKIAETLEIKVADLMGISDYIDDVEQSIHKTTSFRDYLNVLGYEVHESPYDNNKLEVIINESDQKIYINDEEMGTLESTTKENIDLRINKYLNDGNHKQ